MTRITLILMTLLAFSLSAKSDIDRQIVQTSGQIRSFEKQYSSLNSKMTKNARSILKGKQTILKQQKLLQQLKLELKAKAKDYERQKKDLAKAKASRNSLDEEQAKIEHDLVFAIASNASLSMMLDDERVISADALMTEEVLKNLSRQTQQEIASLHNQFSSNNERIIILQERIDTLKDAISTTEKRRKKVIQTQDENKKALKRLEKDKRTYRASIERLLSRQNSLQKTLNRLNIIKEDKAQKAREAAAKRKAAREQAAREKAAQERASKQGRRTVAKATLSKDLPSVKMIGSSYQKIKTKPYRGSKTIAPLDSYRLVKRFGPYTDPIYNLKIFNESVSLQPDRQNAKVKNVLNGKVILAQSTALLDNVVIIEHGNGIHTIYAHMDKIAPTVKKGQKIKKGSVIGRISDELMFEVTQKNYHINPMQLIH